MTTKTTKKRGGKRTGAGRKPGSKNKVRSIPVVEQDLFDLLQGMVDKVVEAKLGHVPSPPVQAEKAAPAPKIFPKDDAPKTYEQAKLLFSRAQSFMDIPNPDNDKFYYWVQTHPWEQQRALREGMTFVVGRDECLRLGFAPEAYYNGRGRIGIFDIELAWMPKTLAEMRRKFMTESTKETIKQTGENFKRLARQVGDVIEKVDIRRQAVRSKGDMFTTDDE